MYVPAYRTCLLHVMLIGITIIIIVTIIIIGIGGVSYIT